MTIQIRMKYYLQNFFNTASFKIWGSYNCIFDVFQGWEETVDAAVSHLLKTCLSRSPKDQAISLSTGPLIIPKDTSYLKKHITLLCDRLGKGGRLSLSSEASVSPPVMMQGQNCKYRPFHIQLFNIEWICFDHCNSGMFKGCWFLKATLCSFWGVLP